MVRRPERSRGLALPRLLLALLCASAVPCALASARFPDAPPSPPSAAAEAAARAPNDAAAAASPAGGSRRGHHAAAKVPLPPPPRAIASYGATVAAAGLVAGAATAWQGVFQTVLKGRLSPQQIGLLGLANTGLGCVGAVVVAAPPAARVAQSAGLKRVLLALLVAAAGLALAWALAPHSNFTVALALVAALGAFQGAADPVFVELAAELVPVTETTSNGVLVLVWNATSCVLLALPTALLGEQTMNYAFLAVLAAAAGLVGLVVDEVHCRPTDADAQETRIGHLQETGSDVSTTF